MRHGAELTPLETSVLRFIGASSDLQATSSTLAEHGFALFASWRLREALSDEVRSALKAAARPYLLATMRADDLASKVTTVLAAANVRHVVLKGPALARLWRDRGGPHDLRTYTDLDVLIDPRDRQPADTALATASMQRGPVTDGEAAYEDLDGAPLDLHWLLLNDDRLCQRFRLDTTALLDRHVQWSGWTGELSPTFTLLHTALHASVSDLSKLSAMIDVDAAASQQTVDWEDVVQTALHHDLGLVVAVALRRVTHWTGLVLPAGVLRELAPGSPWSAAAAVVARRPPERFLQGRWSGAEFFRHTRTSTLKSAAALLADLGMNLRLQAALIRPRTRS